MTNKEWLDSLTQSQIKVVADCWAIKYFRLKTLDEVKEELALIEGIQATPTSMAKVLTDRVLTYYQRDRRVLENYTHFANCTNELCYDQVDMRAVIEDGVIIELGFWAKGCVISEASAAMLVEYFQGRTLDEARNFTDKDMLDLVGVPIAKPREECVLLGLKCLRELYGSATIT